MSRASLRWQLGICSAPPTSLSSGLVSSQAGESGGRWEGLRETCPRVFTELMLRAQDSAPQDGVSFSPFPISCLGYFL